MDIAEFIESVTAADVQSEINDARQSLRSAETKLARLEALKAAIDGSAPKPKRGRPRKAKETPAE